MLAVCVCVCFIHISFRRYKCFVQILLTLAPRIDLITSTEEFVLCCRRSLCVCLCVCEIPREVVNGRW